MTGEAEAVKGEVVRCGAEAVRCGVVKGEAVTAEKMIVTNGGLVFDKVPSSVPPDHHLCTFLQEHSVTAI